MKVLVTGGCGFIGSNTAQRLLRLGHRVTVLDDLSRVGAEHNRRWLEEQGPVEFVRADIRDAHAVARIIAQGGYEAIIHLAAQVAVTTSVQNPREDFEVNALGTFNILEAVRQYTPGTIVLNASTNKVYGKLAGVRVREDTTRYCLPDLPLGVPETQPVDFHSPYGCSKGVADQYVVDYARVYGLRTVNFRQSCIYGYRQFGVEDQGWVAWFGIAHARGRPVTVYGDGKQVRDVLFIEDLIEAYLAAVERIDHVQGMTFNIGGGPENRLSLLEFLSMLREVSGRAVVYSFADWRPGDQRAYVSDIRSAGQHLGWRPRVDAAEGISRLYRWVQDNLDLFT